MSAKSFLAALMALASMASLHADLVFAGYLYPAQETRFVVSETQTGRSSEWLREGDSFGGYTISGFDPHSEVLLLKKGPEQIRLPLKAATVSGAKNVAPSAPPRFTIAIAADGSLSADGRNIGLDEVKQRFAVHRGRAEPIEIHLRIAPVMDTERRILNSINGIFRLGREAGVRMSLKIDR